MRGAVEFREIRREGIRCRLRWNVGKDKVHAGTSTFDDEEHARRHEARKAAEWIGKGFVEVDPVLGDAAAGTDSKVLDVIKASVKHGSHPGFTPVPGFEETYRCELTPGHPLSHHEYYVLCAQGRNAISFNVRADAHDGQLAGGPHLPRRGRPLHPADRADVPGRDGLSERLLARRQRGIASQGWERLSPWPSGKRPARPCAGSWACR